MPILWSKIIVKWENKQDKHIFCSAGRTSKCILDGLPYLQINTKKESDTGRGKNFSLQWRDMNLQNSPDSLLICSVLNQTSDEEVLHRG